MTTLRHAVLIDRPISEAYSLAQQVERYPEFLPGYIESRIILRQGNRVLLQRRAILRGRTHEWKSWVTFLQPESIQFEHAEGPLKGMRVTWSFQPQGLHRTSLVIQHDFRIRHPFIGGWFLEKWIFRPKINELASLVVVAFKKACESRPLVAA